MQGRVVVPLCWELHEHSGVAAWAAVWVRRQGGVAHWKAGHKQECALFLLMYFRESCRVAFVFLHAHSPPPSVLITPR